MKRRGVKPSKTVMVTDIPQKVIIHLAVTMLFVSALCVLILTELVSIESAPALGLVFMVAGMLAPTLKGARHEKIGKLGLYFLTLLLLWTTVAISFFECNLGCTKTIGLDVLIAFALLLAIRIMPNGNKMYTPKITKQIK